jgi:hypothetical protein
VIGAGAHGLEVNEPDGLIDRAPRFGSISRVNRFAVKGIKEMLRTAIVTVSTLAVAGGVFALSNADPAASAAPVAGSAVAAHMTAVAHSPAADSYTAVANALTAGKDVEITTELQQCTSPDGTAGPDVIGGLRINAFQVVPGQEIVFSDTHQTLDPQNATITEFIRYTVTPDGATTVATTTLSASDQVQSVVQLNCRIGKGAYFHW